MPSPAVHAPVQPPPAPTPPALIGCYRSARDLRGSDLLTFASLRRQCVLDLFHMARDLKARVNSSRPSMAPANVKTKANSERSENRGATQSRIQVKKTKIAQSKHPNSSLRVPPSSSVPSEFVPSPLNALAFALLFEKASLRTKMSFESGIARLGGHPIFMDHTQQRLGEREAVKDYAKNLERWVDAIIARVYSQDVLYELAEHAQVPVINALSDRFHPCQALADLFTLFERANHDEARLKETRIAYVGDGNNVCHSLMHAACTLGSPITVISPKGYEPAQDVTAECQAMAKDSGGSLLITSDLSAIESHHAVYTDVWVSMGQADTAGKRRKVFQPYQVNATLMARASKGLRAPAAFMHCLPAQRGVEATDDVLDAPSSIVYDQAENRMHAQNALLAAMFD